MTTKDNHIILLGAIMVLALPGCDPTPDELGPLSLRDGGSSGASSDVTKVVNPGEHIDFVVDRNTHYAYDSTALDVLIVGQ